MRLSTPLLLLVVIILGIIVFVGGAEVAFGLEFENPLKYDSIVKLIDGIATWLLSIGGALATVVILWAAFMYLTSGGSEERTTQAKKALLWAVVGIAILAVGKGITGIIKGILEVQ